MRLNLNTAGGRTPETIEIVSHSQYIRFTIGVLFMGEYLEIFPGCYVSLNIGTDTRCPQQQSETTMAKQTSKPAFIGTKDKPLSGKQRNANRKNGYNLDGSNRAENKDGSRRADRRHFTEDEQIANLNAAIAKVQERKILRECQGDAFVKAASNAISALKAYAKQGVGGLQDTIKTIEKDRILRINYLRKS